MYFSIKLEIFEKKKVLWNLQRKYYGRILKIEGKCWDESRWGIIYEWGVWSNGSRWGWKPYSY